MLKILTIFVSLGLGLSAFAGIASAQEDISSDGGYVTATDDNGGEMVQGDGNTVVYGDVSTGNTGGEVLGDPNAVYYPDLSQIPSPTGEPWTPTIVGIPVGGHSTSGDLFDGFDISFDPQAAAPAEDAIAIEDQAVVVDGSMVSE